MKKFQSNDYYIKEKNIGISHIVSKEENNIILNQLEKCICKIIIENEVKGSGFLCKVPFPDQFTLFPGLLTNNHVLKEEDIIKCKKIDISFDEDKIKKTIYLNERKFSSDENLDFTIIEIKPNDDALNDFLEVDEHLDLLENNIPIYILQYPKGKKSSFSIGSLKKINGKDILHNCSTGFGSSGSPILKLSNFKVIGIHKGAMKKFELNCGSPMNDIINRFNKEYKPNKKNITDKAQLKIKKEKNKSCSEQKFKKIENNNFINKKENAALNNFFIKEKPLNVIKPNIVSSINFNKINFPNKESNIDLLNKKAEIKNVSRNYKFTKRNFYKLYLYKLFSVYLKNVANDLIKSNNFNNNLNDLLSKNSDSPIHMYYLLIILKHLIENDKNYWAKSKVIYNIIEKHEYKYNLSIIVRYDKEIINPTITIIENLLSDYYFTRAFKKEILNQKDFCIEVLKEFKINLDYPSKKKDKGFNEKIENLEDEKYLKYLINNLKLIIERSEKKKKISGVLKNVLSKKMLDDFGYI